MSTSAFWVILAVVGFDLLILPLIIYALVRGSWSPLVERYPAAPIGEDAVRRNFQSYKIGLLNLGLCVHTAVDEGFLHLRPAMFGRVIGMRDTSVPWEAVEPVRRRGKRYAEVKIAGETVMGPAWALGLAFEGGAAQEEAGTAR